MTYREKIDMLYRMGEDTTKIRTGYFFIHGTRSCICGHHHGCCESIEIEAERFGITRHEANSLFFPGDMMSLENAYNPVYHGKKVMALAKRKMKTKRYKESL